MSATPAKILIGISLDAEDSAELLSWAIRNVAHPNDTVVALHVLVTEGMNKPGARRKEETKEWKSIAKYQTQIRKAKAFVISVMADFAKTCQSNQNLINCVQVGILNYQLYCIGNLVVEAKRDMPSPRTVLDEVERESGSTEEYSSSTEGLSITMSPLQAPLKQRSPLQRISSFLRSPFDQMGRKGNEFLSIREKQQPSLRCFSFEEIANATNNFHQVKISSRGHGQTLIVGRLDAFNWVFDANSFFYEYMIVVYFCKSLISSSTENIVGRGGYSEVYKGDLEDGCAIAVKSLARDNTDEHKEKEFLVELGIIGHVNHPNTASLVGCCVENGLYLIFNFYPNGTLSSALHGKRNKSLEWPVRYNIALGIAKGLHYLHKCCKHRIIHRDIKASNVLLGPNYEPQISDFGLAKWLPSKWTHHAVIPIEGTFGYLAPEYFMHGIVDEKTDVFAFGVLLLEIITGRRPVDSSRQNLLLWARPLMESGNIDDLVDPRLGGRYDMDQMHRLLLTVSYCVRQSTIWRPSMTEVLHILSHGHDSEVTQNWRIPESTPEAEEMDDYSMFFGYELPSDLFLEDI
ncbi:hypothetical protein RJ639_041231 [Escallonia herrerae]|uniref:Protein kinase domain-containing protein n=1 Tax=Escallonia herrerae TaxID=1293975 RepID=A0AA89B6G6_9ASTE|nr:hypothetical protein RJ639_041231 [Escallonia herrerae]